MTNWRDQAAVEAREESIARAAAAKAKGAHSNGNGKAPGVEILDDGQLPEEPPEVAESLNYVVNDPEPLVEWRDGFEFALAYEPLDYVIDGIARTGHLYSLTASTGHGKTGFFVLLLLAIVTGRGQELLGREVKQGRVAYICIENSDDVRMRYIATAYHYGIDPDVIRKHVVFIEKNEKLEAITATLRALSADGEFVAVLGDTFIAMFVGDNPNDPLQTRRFMARFRPMTKLPGRPAVFVACHPVKNAAEDNLKPQGSGATLNEVDGNLTLWKANETAETTKLHWQGKLRGLDFQPVIFRFDVIACPTLVDAKGCDVKMAVMSPTTTDSGEEREKAEHANEKALLLEIMRNPTGTFDEWARAVGKGKSSVARYVRKLEREKLVEQVLGKWMITKKGVEALKKVGEKTQETEE